MVVNRASVTAACFACAALLSCAALAGERVQVVRRSSHWMELNERPVLLVGDSITQGWMELGTAFDQNAYVDALARRGINLVLLWSYIGITDQVNDPRIGYDAPELWPWKRADGRFDLEKFNDSYFERLRQFVKYAGTKGIVVVITVHDGWTKTRFAGHPFNLANGGTLSDKKQYVELYGVNREMPEKLDAGWSRRAKHQFYLEQFCDRLIDATGREPNVIYEMFNEGEWYEQRRLHDFEAHFLSFFRRRTTRPLMANDDDAVGKRPLLEDASFDVLSLHQPRWDRQPPATTFFDHFEKAFQKAPERPVLFSETVPEYGGESDKTDGIIRLLWGTAMAGAGVAFQNDTSWGFDPRTTMASRQKERDAVLDLEGHLARFFNASGLDLANLKPDPKLASTGICLANAGNEYIVFAEKNEPKFTLDSSGATHAALQQRWYDPRTGKFTEWTDVALQPGHEFRCPLKGPNVLHLKKRSK